VFYLSFSTNIKNHVPKIFILRIWSSAQDHTVLVLLLHLVGFFISIWPRWSVGNVLYHSCTSFEGAFRGGQPLNIFTSFIGAGGESLIMMSKKTKNHVGCVRVSLSFSLSSLQLLVVSFIVYWERGCVCVSDPELVMEFPGSLVVFVWHEGEED